MSTKYPHEKAMPHDRLRYALAIISGRIIAPTIETCFVLGFGPNDLRQLSIGEPPQPPHIEAVRARCEQIVYEAIMRCKSE